MEVLERNREFKVCGVLLYDDGPFGFVLAFFDRSSNSINAVHKGCDVPTLPRTKVSNRHSAPRRMLPSHPTPLMPPHTKL